MTESMTPASPVLARSVEDTATRVGCGRTTLYAAIKSNALTARKIGRRTVILEDDLRRWLNSLPSRDPGAA